MTYRIKWLLSIALDVFCLWSCESTKEQDIQVLSVSLSQSTAEICVGETVELKATIVPSNATLSEITWATTKSTVATVSEKGLITAVGEGTATIVASAGGKSGSCLVTVSKGIVAVYSIELNARSVELSRGDTYTLEATVSPEDATNKSIIWSSSDDSVASVEDGVVSASEAGTAIISAEAGGKKATCLFTITVPVESLTLNKTSLSLTENQKEQLTAYISPEDATNKDIAWSSSNTSVAVVDSDGEVLAIKKGACNITATLGDISAECIVTVDSPEVPVSNIELSGPTRIERGKTGTAIAIVYPSNATNKSVTWSSSDDKIISVDSHGTLNALSIGHATITASAGSVSKSMNVYVYVPAQSISLYSEEYGNLTDNTVITLTKGEATQVKAILTPDDATDTVTWTSYPETVVSVDQTGLIQAIGGGEGYISVKAGDLMPKRLRVSVVVPTESISLDISSKTIKQYEEIILNATILPEDATDKSISWSSSNTSVAIVDKNGKVTGGPQEGSATITALAGSLSASCEITVISCYDPVDLGLSVEWASFNVGANKPEEIGNFYAWGETTTKTVYDAEHYKYYEWSDYYMSYSRAIKYNTNPYRGPVDNKTVLEAEDDAARATWGGEWRIPTKSELEEISNPNNCSWTWTILNGQNGCIVESKINGNSIFLPAAGFMIGTNHLSYRGVDYGVYDYGLYWSANLLPENDIDKEVWYLRLGAYGVLIEEGGRHHGLTVRPVRTKVSK